MQFLNPLFLIGSLALIGPILVHLVRRETSRKHLFSSLMFIHRRPKASLQRQRLRHPLLLLLRLAALLLLVLAFARPLLTDPDAFGLAQSSVRSLVILLDDSYSMRFGDRFQRGQMQAQSILKGMAPGDRVQTVLFSDSPRILNRPEANPRQVQQLIDTLEPGFGGTDYGPALRLAGQLLAEAPESGREVHWISDFQESGWKPGSKNVPIDDTVDVRAYPMARVPGPNVSIRQVTVHPEEPAASRVTIAVEVRSQHLRQALDLNLALEINDQPHRNRTVRLGADDSKLVEFKSVAVPQGMSTAKLQVLFDDALPQDNLAYSSLSPPPRIKTLLLGRRRGRDHFYISKALTASADSPFDLEVADPGQIQPARLGSYAAVILNDIGNLSSEMASGLTRFVKSGGGLLLILGPRSNAASLANLKGVLPAALLKRSRATGRGGDRQIGRLQRQHPVFSHFEDVHYSYFMTTRYSDYFLVQPVNSSRVLATLQDGSPLLLERAIGDGLVLLFTSSLNREWNELPLTSVFLPFCQQMVKYAIRFESSPRSHTVGDTVTLQSLNPQLAKTLAQLSASNRSFAHSWAVRAPSGRVIQLDDLVQKNRSSLKLTEPGFYRSRVHDLEHVLATNLDADESDLTSQHPERLLSRLARVTGRPGGPPRRETSADKRQALESRQHLWWYLVLTGLLALLVESFLANRYPSGVQN